MKHDASIADKVAGNADPRFDHVNEAADSDQKLRRKHNRLWFYPDSQPPCVVKRHGDMPFRLKSLGYSIADRLGMKIPVEYRSAEQRCQFERECLELWQRYGFRVPELLREPEQLPLPEGTLCMEYVRGATLEKFLQDPSVSLEEKLNVVARVFSEMAQRHALALFEGRHELIHYDSNTRNVILNSGRPFYIDFEMGHLSERIDRSAAREVKKLCLEIVNHLGCDLLDDVSSLLVSHYDIRHIIRRVADEELNRPFLKYHLKRNRRRKIANPASVTKLDLAGALRSLAETSRKSDEPDFRWLKDAVESSWHGEIYQSLNDDPRGRDAHHRYRVMEFPSDFSGKSILDIGCNLGRICIDASERNAIRAVGIDNREDVIEPMKRYCRMRGHNVELYTFDIDRGIDALQSLIGTIQFDYVSALSIWSHVDQSRLWELINATCREVFYFEDNAPSRVKSLEKIEATLRANLKFSRVEFLGFTTDRGVRAVYRLSEPRAGHSPLTHGG